MPRHIVEAGFRSGDSLNEMGALVNSMDWGR